jgi:hypothetical protein
MTREYLLDEPSIWIATAVNGRAYDVAYHAGQPIAVRRRMRDGTCGPWWLLTGFPPESEYAEAARQAEAFLAEFRGVAS